MQLGTALNLPNPRINFGATNKVPFKGENAIFTFTANALDPRITFSRTTNATVTNSAGLITYAPHNLLTHSEQFDNSAWSKSNATVTANSVASPNSTTTADKLVETATTNVHAVFPANYSAQNTVFTVSVYAKAAERTFILLELANFATGGAMCRFNLSTGIAGAASSNTGDYSNVSASITSVGNGWYRCSLTATKGTTNSNNYFVINLDNGTTNNYAGVVGNGLFIWGAQLVQGAVAGDYVRTSSTVMPVMYQAPTGTLSADKLVEDTATNTHAIQQSANVTSGASYTLSCYAKAGERNFVQLLMLGGFASNITAIFDLTTGAVGTTAGSPITQAVNVGNGWWRFSITATANTTTATATQIRPASTSLSAFYAGNGTSGVYIWGAQLSDSASLDPYVYNPVAAPTEAAFYGARFDYDPVTLQPKGLLIEEQRTNLILQSENISSTPWVKSTATTTLDAGIVDPAGNTGTVYYPAISEIVQSFNGNSATTISVSFFGKKRVGSSNDAFVFDFFQQTSGTVVNLGTYAFQLIVSNPDTTYVKNVIRTQYPNGWFRFSFQLLANTGAGLGNFSSSSRLDIEGGLAQNYIWGIQVEVAAFATSYIPTQASQVTRAADTAVIQGSNFSSWYNQNEGTIYTEAQVETNRNYSGTFRHVFQITPVANSNSLSNILVSGSNQFQSQVIDNSISQSSLTIGSNTGAVFKAISAYKANDFAFTVNGTTPQTDTSGNPPTNPFVEQMSIGRVRDNNVLGQLNGHIKSISYYPVRLSNATLQAITS